MKIVFTRAAIVASLVVPCSAYPSESYDVAELK